MKKRYIPSEIEIVKFDVEDIITTSSVTSSGKEDKPIELPMIPIE